MLGAFQLPEYSVVIRTLGKAGEKYRRLLNSLVTHTHQPKEIIIYLAEGYSVPEETCGRERYVYVKKGMVAQRALSYKEVSSEWILFLDDDVEIPDNGVEKAFRLLHEYNAQVIAPDTFEHNEISWGRKIKMALLLSAIPRFWSKTKGYTVTKFGTYCYNPYKSARVGVSTTNAGPAFLCRKQDFLNIHYEQDMWLDESPYAIPDDQVMFYKMHLNGLKILTIYHSGWKHLDAGTSISGERARKIVYSSARNRVIFFYLYITPHLRVWQRPLVAIVKGYCRVLSLTVCIAKCLVIRDFTEYREHKRGEMDARIYLETYCK